MVEVMIYDYCKQNCITIPKTGTLEIVGEPIRFNKITTRKIQTMTTKVLSPRRIRSVQYQVIEGI